MTGTALAQKASGTPTNVGVVALEKYLASRLVRSAKQEQFWLRERDGLIREAHAAGASLREIAQLVGLSHTGVKKIVERQDFIANPTIEEVVAERVRETREAGYGDYQGPDQ